jgi:multidrug efflux system membrane fusion protein
VIAGCGTAEQPRKVPTAVRVQAVELRAASADAARYSATVVPDTKVDLAFKVGGYIQWIETVGAADGAERLIQEGDPVRKGQVLARVKIADYQQQLNAARALQAEANAAKEQARLDYERARGLFESQGVSRAELEGARARWDAAKARAEGAGAQVAAANNAMNDSALRSPLDGIVLERYVEVGTLVGPGAPGFVIADVRSVKAVFGVPDSLVKTLELGSSLAIETEAARGVRFSGRITRVAPSADMTTRVFEVETTIPNPDGALKSGMIATLLLEGPAPRAEPSALVPLSAVVRSPTDPKGFAVMVLELDRGEARARLRNVELGDFLGNFIPVKSGLSEGEQVIVMGASLVSDGELVHVIP